MLFDDVEEVKSISQGPIPIPIWARVPDDGECPLYDACVTTDFLKAGMIWYMFIFVFFLLIFVFFKCQHAGKVKYALCYHVRVIKQLAMMNSIVKNVMFVVF